MAYRVIVSPRAQREIEEAIDYYAQHSADAPRHFVQSLKDVYQALANNPFFRVRYKNIRAVKLRHFPYLLYFIVNERQNTVRLLSCFHGRRNPDDKPMR